MVLGVLCNWACIMHFQQLHWKPYHRFSYPELSRAMREWLLCKTSFITRLKQHGIVAPRIEVQYQGWEKMTPEWRLWMNHAKPCIALKRDVLIRDDKKVWMMARTFIPASSLVGKTRQLMHLNNRSLGSVLFKDVSLKRSDFEIVEMHYPMLSKTKHCWARRSLFWFNKTPLALIELFSPEVETL